MGNDNFDKDFDEAIKKAMAAKPEDIVVDMDDHGDETAKAIEEQKAKLEQAEAERIAKIKEQDQMMDKAREAGRD